MMRKIPGVHRTRVHKTIIGVGALALLASACGDSAAVTDAGAGQAESIEDLEFESPIADFLGEDTSFDFTSDESQAEMAQKEAEAQEQIVLCMREQGFEYVPQDNSQFISFAGEDEELAYFSSAWIDKYGFGITTQRFAQSDVGPDLVGYDDAGFSDEAMEDSVDPNEAYLEALSEGEQEAYYEALWGTEPEIPEGATDAEMDEAYSNWEPDGCQSEAYEEMWGGNLNDFYSEFNDDLDALYELLETDQRVINYRAEVSVCVADKGFEYTNMEELYERFETEMQDIGGGMGAMFDPFEDEEIDPEQMSEDELDEFYREMSALSDEDKAALAVLQAEEIALARVVVDCGGGELNEWQALDSVRIEYEEQFLVDNADRLADYEGSAG